MWKFVLKRLLALIPVLFGVTLLVFLILSFAPGDPARTILGAEATEEQINHLREEMGLNDNVFVQYARYIIKGVSGDLGTSYKTRLPVVTEIVSRFPYTLRLVVVGMIIAIIIALPLGVIAGVKQNSLFDRLSMVLSLLGISLPTFWVGLLCILLFSVTLGWLPSGGNDSLKDMILPTLTISLCSLAGIARTTRSSMLEVIRADYIRTARGKGISQAKVVIRHALQNAMIPTLTVAGLQICNMIAGTVLVENIFSWPGIGRLLVTSIQERDIPLVLGCIIVFTICFTIINLVVDILYGVIDPRIKAQYKK
ncbi:MAG: Glutathione transport system permease protein GsiC [Firmicutes bacterium ADurb.Bin248]|jgi:peptide/nickel transport system permease protein|nr:MAG: Glutathione transport system permease protein GsiC [Firmicutes bacterium ADurb.Bin248]HOG00549.1 ABC transporter permease [Clostridia bacterium]HPK16148.1 ABC transporter permease [Clostridia bacterium]